VISNLAAKMGLRRSPYVFTEQGVAMFSRIGFGSVDLLSVAEGSSKKEVTTVIRLHLCKAFLQHNHRAGCSHRWRFRTLLAHSFAVFYGLMSMCVGVDLPRASIVRQATALEVWQQGKQMPVALGEVAGGIVGNMLYIVGHSSTATLGYDLATKSWRNASDLAQRPHPGGHHCGAEVSGGKLYLLGCLGDGLGQVQIYDPQSNSWSIGTHMPFAVGSSASALINGEMYVAGGITESNTTTNAVAKYHPVSNSWTTLSPMPQGRNHAAAATDGSRLYVFGGRGPGSGDGNVVANGFNTVQIYDPSTDTWESSDSANSQLAPLPQARGGTGKAIYLGGEFYVMGGETATGAGATTVGVYNRVDIYNPTNNSWRLGAPMPTARHGIFPLSVGCTIYVAGGGIRAGHSDSAALEIFPSCGGDMLCVNGQCVSTTTLVVHLRASNGQYVVAEGGGGGVVNANRDVAQTWETFVLFDHNGGTLANDDVVSLRTFNRLYLMAQNGGGGALQASSSEVSSHEKFVIVNVASGSEITHNSQIALRANNSQFVVAELGGGNVVNANRDAIGSWEVFTLEKKSHP
jgi:N-acetylneuraminic acid mutarotase